MSDFTDAYLIKDAEIKKLQAKLDKANEALKVLKDAVRISANQLEGVSLAITTHGQNINSAFFIVNYKDFANEARESLKKVDEILGVK